MDLLYVVVGIVGAVIGAGVLTIGLGRFRRQLRLRRRTAAVEATVVTSSVVSERVLTDGGTSGLAGDGSDSDARYRPHVEYVYEFGDERYRSSRFRAGPQQWYGTHKTADVLREDYPEGTTTTARVDPIDPETAFLQPPSTTATNAVFSMLGLIATASGLLLVQSALA